MRFNGFSLIVFIHFVICINESDGQRRYSVNHPPSVEDYNPIPVAVVYEDDVIDVKSPKPKYYDISRDRNVKQKVSTTEGSQPLAPKEIQELKASDKNETDSETGDILVRPTARALGELHIPVAVIYDSPSDNTQNSQAVEQEETNKRRRKIKRVSRRKPLDIKATAENANFTNQSTQEPQIVNKNPDKSDSTTTKLDKLQLSRTESTELQTKNYDSVQPDTRRTKLDKPHLSNAESAKPQIEIKDSGKSDTWSSKPVKPQLSRTESLKPQTKNDVAVKSDTQRTNLDKPQLSSTESAKSQIEIKDSGKSETGITEAVKPQLSRTESTKLQIGNDDSFKSKSRRIIPDKPQLRRTESAKPQIQIEEDSVKSETEVTKAVKPQLSRSESAKPRRIESARPSPLNIETIKEEVKTKRVRDPVVPIVEMENYIYAHSGNFHYSYEGGDGTKAHSEGQLRSIDEAAGEAVSGGFSYTDKEGNDFSITYTADEHGYRPIGAHLPTPPPIPPAIARALAYLATATTPEPVTKPSVKNAGKSL